MIKNFERIIMLILVCIVFFDFSGCSVQMRQQEEVPEAEYDKVGTSVKIEINNKQTAIITYAIIGVKEDEIIGVYLDQIEKSLIDDRHFSTNKEKGISYGLSFTSDHGEWNEQVEALENYIAGNKLTIEQVNEIPIEKKNKGNGIIPKKGSDLEAGCELDIENFLYVINDAYNNLQEESASVINVGENIRIISDEECIAVSFAFVTSDYAGVIKYAKLEEYNICLGNEVMVEKVKCGDLEGLSKFIVGLSLDEACSIETYDPGNGIDLAIPVKESELSKVCSADISGVLKSLKECKERMQEDR